MGLLRNPDRVIERHFSLKIFRIYPFHQIELFSNLRIIAKEAASVRPSAWPQTTDRLGISVVLLFLLVGKL